MGKQGDLTALLKEVPKLDASLRPEMGKAVNQAKAQLYRADRRSAATELEAQGLRRSPPDFDMLRSRLPAPAAGRSAPHHPDVLRPE